MRGVYAVFCGFTLEMLANHQGTKARREAPIRRGGRDAGGKLVLGLLKAFFTTKHTKVTKKEEVLGTADWR